MQENGHIRMLEQGEEPRPGEMKLDSAQFNQLVNETMEKRQEFYRQFNPKKAKRLAEGK